MSRRGGVPAPPLPPGGTFSVSEIVHASAGVLSELFGDVRIEGELSGVRVYSSGHCYFTLKDDQASMSGVMWSSSLRRLKFRPEDGQRVVVRGQVTIYAPRGQYQVQALDFEPAGLGALALALEQLKARLEKEGVFAAERKRPLPMLPKVVGIVTSKDGAALRDILRVLGDRHSGLRVVVADTRVQGAGAAAEIARALGLLNAWGKADVIIVGRGGGSMEDLWAFNEEPVVRAIAASKVPVISAVGHEVDWTLADLAADRRAATPSNAAEIVTAEREQLLRRVATADARLLSRMRGRLREVRGEANRLAASPALAGFPARCAAARARLDGARRLLGEGPRRAAARLARRLAQADGSLSRWPATLALDERRRRVVGDRDRAVAAIRRRLSELALRREGAGAALGPALVRRVDRQAGRLATAAARLDALSPLAVLQRGYAIAFRERPGEPPRALLRSLDARPGDSLRVRLHDGELRARVLERLGEAPPENRSLFDEPAGPDGEPER